MRRFGIAGGLLLACLLVSLSMTTLGSPPRSGTQEMSSRAPESTSVAPARFTQGESAGDTWYRGQVHIHTNWTPIDDVVSWYRYHGYAFAVVTELNQPTPLEGVKGLFDSPGRFLVMPGIELSVAPRGKYVDTLGLGGDPQGMWDVWRPQMPGFGDASPGSASDILDRQARAVADAGGLPVAAHPNFTWAYTHTDILDTEATRVRHFELRNAEHGMNDLGGGGRPSTEEMWDAVLSTGRVLYALTTDDSHHFDDFGTDDFYAEGKRQVQAKALPGRTSIYVRAPELTPRAILAAIERGDFYSVVHFTNLPIELKTYAADDQGIRLTLPEVSKDKGNTRPGSNITRYRTYFIGKDGKVLKRDDSLTPSYTFTGDELYVRARVEDSDGGIAWSQPVFPGRR